MGIAFDGDADRIVAIDELGRIIRSDILMAIFVKSLSGSNDTIKVAFGTEGGLFSSELLIPTVVCGPGSMNQGHKPDEFVSAVQLKACDQMLSTLINRLQKGI